MSAETVKFIHPV